MDVINVLTHCVGEEEAAETVPADPEQGLRAIKTP